MLLDSVKVMPELCGELNVTRICYAQWKKKAVYFLLSAGNRKMYLHVFLLKLTYTELVCQRR